MKIIENWVKINDESLETYNINSQIRFKTSMLVTSLCDYSDAYILVKGTITVAKTGIAATPNNANKKVIFKNCAPFTSCISRINNTKVDDAEYIDVVMWMYNLIEYSDCQFCRDERAVDDNGTTTDFNKGKVDTNSFNLKVKLTGQTDDNSTKVVETMISLKHLSNF